MPRGRGRAMPRLRLRASCRRSRLIRLLVVAACLYAGMAGAQTVQRQLVIPFESVTKDPQSYWLSEGSAVILTDDLITLGAPAITRDDRLRAFERLRVPAVATLSHATVMRLGQLVGAGEVIIGSFEVRAPAAGTPDAGDIIVHARAIRPDTGRMGAELVESGPMASLFDVYARLARRLVPGSGVSSEQLEQAQPPIAAIEQYVKGLLAQTPAARVAFLDQALRVYPGLQRARIELWRIRTEEGNHKAALATVREVAPSHRLSRQARFLSGVSMVHLGEYDQAFMVFSQLNTVIP